MNRKDNEEIEELDTVGMLERGFLMNLANPELKNKIKESKASESIRESLIKESISNYNTEEMLMALYEVRDSLIDSFKNIDIDSEISQSLSANINKLGICIKKMGGEAESFDPFNYLSGLQNPSTVKSAERVIETTKQCYALGKIEDCFVKDAGKTILITFSGNKNNISYKAKGTITALRSWTGNEAIDYLYKTGSGKMSVKAYDNGKWVDKSDDYSVNWELDESEISQKEEVNVSKIANNMKDDIDIGDFPISEVKK